MVLLEMDDDGGPAILPHIGGDLVNIVRSDAVGIPDEGGLILSLLVGRPGPDLDPVPDHECRIEADAELANDPPGGVERATSLGALGQLIQKGLGSRPGDGAQVVDHLLLGQADARVGDGQRTVELVGFDANFQGHLVGVDSDISRATSSSANLPDMPELLEGVGCIAHQLPEKHLLVGV